MLRGRKDAAAKTIRSTYAGASEDYIALKLIALEEVVEVSAEFQRQYSPMQRLKVVFTQSRYAKPAITALGIGIFQQLCGFNSLSESS